MSTILGICFSIFATILTLCIVYCILMSITAGWGWLLVAVGIAITDILAIRISVMLLSIAK